MEAKKRPSTEKNIPNDYFRLKLGTINKNNPEVVYIEGKTFISPLNDDACNKNRVLSFRKALSLMLSERLGNHKLFENRYILDFQVANSGIQVNKKSFLSFQILLKQRRNNIMPMKKLKNESNDFITTLMYDFKNYLIKSDYAISRNKKAEIYA